jgi:hypothetical protein
MATQNASPLGSLLLFRETNPVHRCFWWRKEISEELGFSPPADNTKLYYTCFSKLLSKVLCKTQALETATIM